MFCWGSWSYLSYPHKQNSWQQQQYSSCQGAVEIDTHVDVRLAKSLCTGVLNDTLINKLAQSEFNAYDILLLCQSLPRAHCTEILLSLGRDDSITSIWIMTSKAVY